LEEHPLPADLVDHGCIFDIGKEKQVPANLLMIKAQSFLVEVEADIKDGDVDVRTGQSFQRNEESSPKISGNTVPQLHEVNVGIRLLQDAVIRIGSSPKVKVGSILGEQEVAALLKQETL
jgi:hypothetical protein